MAYKQSCIVKPWFFEAGDSQEKDTYLRSMRDLEDYAIDGVIGYVKDFHIDDEAWVIRYFVIDTGRY